MAQILVRDVYALGTDDADVLDASEWNAVAQLVGGAGNDLYILQSGAQTVVETADGGTDTIRLRASGTTFLLPEFVETLLLEGNGGNLTGNDAGNRIVGSGADDTLDGGAGNDTLVGGDGSDDYFVSDALDQVVEAEDEGIDRVLSSVNITLAANVENLELLAAGLVGIGNGLDNMLVSAGEEGGVTLSGGGGDDSITGDLGDDVLNGDIGDDTLDGGFGGRDTLVGGTGNDVYVSRAAQGALVDTITEGVNGGDDLLLTDASFVQMAANLESVSITGFDEDDPDAEVIGNALNNAIIGGEGNDTLSGGFGNDLLDGGGGIDSMTGGTGNDLYHVDEATDEVEELAGQGTDTVNAALSYTLGENVENLRLLDAAGVAFAIGNALGNRITGNASANFIQGLAGDDIIDGGEDGDLMQGGAGSDAYYVDDAGDTVLELAGGGTADTVFASVDYRLPANVESLTLLGLDDLWAIGNLAANRITGNAGSNVLDGGGAPATGPGDTLIGGAGDDAYWLRGTNAIVTEASNGGNDVIITRLTGATPFVLAPNVEALVLEAGSTGAADGNLLGNLMRGTAGSNTLRGLGGNDSLYGGGGADNLAGGDANDFIDGGRGSDSMDGGAGNDTFIVDVAGDTVIGGGGIDLVRSGAGSFTLGADVENLQLVDSAVNGTGNLTGNVITGNARANTLIGLAGNDLLDGGSGDDTLEGGLGSDTYLVDSAGDLLVDTVSGALGGIDVVRATASVDLSGPEPSGIEQVFLLGDDDLDAVGNALANLLAGNAGDNFLDGDTGADTLRGGAGDDTYGVDAAGDVITEVDGEGDDTVVVAAAFAPGYLLPAFVENGELADGIAITLVGNGLDNVLTGNDLANRLEGGVGDDILVSSGESGAADGATDTLVGGTGDDAYFVDSVADVVIEALGGGRDLVALSAGSASIAGYTIATNVEDLLILAGGEGGIVNGNSLDNEVGMLYADVVGLNGGAGRDVLSVLGDTSRTLLTTTNTEVLRVEGGSASITIDAASVAAATTGTGLEVVEGSGSVAFTGLATAIAALEVRDSARDVSLDWTGAATIASLAVTLSDAGASGVGLAPDDPVQLTLADSVTSLRLVSQGQENLVTLAGTAPGALTVSGDAALTVEGLANGGTVRAESYSGLLLSLGLADGTGDFDALAVQLQGSSLALAVDDGTGGRTLETLVVSVANSSGANALDLRLASPDLGISISGGAGAGTELELRVGSVNAVDAGDFLGRFTLISNTDAGADTGILVEVPETGAYTLLLGAGNDQVSMFGNLGAGVLVRGGRADDFSDQDSVSMDLTGLAAGAAAPWVEDVEVINVNVDSGTGTLDGSFIFNAPAGTVINVSGASGATVVLQDIDVSGVDADGFSGTLQVFLSGGVFPGDAVGTSVNGGGGSDLLVGALGDDGLFGAAGADRISGGDGDDEVAGGIGADTLNGGEGSDRFVFDATDLGTGTDTLEDFESGEDSIVLSGGSFVTDLPANTDGTLQTAALEAGATPSDGGLSYDQALGQLWYDPLGIDGASLLFQLDPGTRLLASDILIETGT